MGFFKFCVGCWAWFQVLFSLGIFDDPDVSHVEGDVDPIRDMEIIREELRLKDEEYVNTVFDKLEKAVIRGGDKKQKPDYDCIAKAKHLLCEEHKGIRFGEWNAAEIEILNDHLFITSKPVIYLINMSEKDFFRKKNKWFALAIFTDFNTKKINPNHPLKQKQGNHFIILRWNRSLERNVYGLLVLLYDWLFALMSTRNF